MEKRAHSYSFEKQLATLGIFFLILGISYSYFVHVKNTYYSITSFDACVKAGFTLTVTYPEECRMPGKRFVNERQKAALENNSSSQISYTEAPFKTAKYFFEGTPFMLVHGIGVIQENSKTHTPRRQFEILPGEITEDINKDGKADTAFLFVEVSQKPNQVYLSAHFGLNEGYVGGALTQVFPYISTSTLETVDGTFFVTSGTSTIKRKQFELRNNLFIEKK